MFDLQTPLSALTPSIIHYGPSGLHLTPLHNEGKGRPSSSHLTLLLKLVNSSIAEEEPMLWNLNSNSPIIREFSGFGKDAFEIYFKISTTRALIFFSMLLLFGHHYNHPSNDHFRWWLPQMNWKQTLVEGPRLPSIWMQQPIIALHTWLWFMSVFNMKKNHNILAIVLT